MIGLGTAALALPYGPPGLEQPPPPRAQAQACVRAAADLGLRLVDTAPAYGEAEAITGAALAGRADVAVATKVRVPPGGWAAVADVRAWVRASVDASLRALRRERLDVLQLHSADVALLGGAHGVLDALLAERDAGRVARLGATVYAADEAQAACAAAPLEVVQVPGSALDRRLLPEALRAAGAARLPEVHVRSVLLRGTLSPAALRLPASAGALRQAAGTVRAALGVGWDDLPGAALAWAAAQPGVGCALAGPRDTAELEALLAGAAAWPGTAGPMPEVDPALLDPRAWAVA